MSCPYYAKSRDRLAVTAAVLALTNAALANVWHVPGDYPTIQGALNAAASGDEIVVAPGTYHENISFAGKNVIVRATYPSVSLSDPLDPAGASIIDGSQPADPNFGSAVRFAGTEWPACTLDGFTITGGTGVKQTSGDMMGGGIFGGNAGTYGVWTRATITRCTVQANTARFGGGLSHCGGTISACHIVGNWTAFPGSNHSGGGLQGCGGTIVGCRIEQNQAYEGGGLHTCLGALIVNCDITENSVTWSGGGMMWCDYCTVVNCNISRNHASLGGFGAGGAVFSQPATYINCTLANNTALAGGAIYAWQANAPTIHNCVLWGNVASNGEGQQIKLNTSPGTYCRLVIDYSDLQGGQTGVWVSDPTWCVIQWGAGMIVADPLFTDAGGGNFRPAAGSPCIDAASNTEVPADVTTDLDGRPRFVDDPNTPDTGQGTPPIVDMGPYEFQPVHPGDLNCDGMVDFDDIDPFVLALSDPTGYAATYPNCNILNGDCNGDGYVDFDDINPFVAILSGGG